MPDSRLGWGGNALPNESMTFRDITLQERAVEAEQSNEELRRLAVEDNWVSSGAGRALERMQEFKPDPTFRVNKEQFEGLRQQFGYESAKDLATATSKEELTQRSQWYEQDIERRNKLAGYGLTGVAASVTAALIDPVGWGAAILTGPIGTGAKISQVGRALRFAAIGGVEATAMESIMYAGDTQRTFDDILLSAAVGGVMGGTIGAATRSARASKSTMVDTDETVLSADTFDSAFSREVRAAMERDAEKAVREVNPVIGDIGSRLEELRGRANFRISGKEKGYLKRDIRANEAELAEVEARLIRERASKVAAIGAPRNAEEAAQIQAAKLEVESQYAGQIQEIQANLFDLRGKLDKADGVTAAKREYKEFLSLDKNEQLRRINAERGIDFDAEMAKASDFKENLRAVLATRETKEVDPDVPEVPTQSTTAQPPSDEPAFELGDRLSEEVDKLVDEANINPPRIVAGKSKAARMVQSTFATLATSDNPAFRGLARRLLENPQGNTYAPRTASILNFFYGKLMRSAGKNRYNDGFSEFLKESGVSPVKGYLDKSIQREFDRKVYRAIVAGVNEDTPASVSKAAAGAAAQLKKALELRRDAGEAGFENIEARSGYIPVITDGVKIATAIAKNGRGHIKDLISKGYQTGRIKLKKGTADKVADLQIVRALDSTLSSRVSFERVVSASERELFMRELREAGLPEEDIAQFLEDKAIAEQAASVSNRAKLSLGLNTQAEIRGVKVMDLLNTNLPELVENYTKEAAGGAAMAKMGFPTKQSALDVIDAAERTGQNMGFGIGRMQEEADMLRDSVNLLYGNTIDENPNAGYVLAARRMRDYTALVRLGQLGFAQFPEVSRAVAHLGLNTVLSSVPNVALFRRRLARGGDAAGSLKEPELREMEELLGYIGEDNWLHGWSVRHDEFGENPDLANKISDVADRALSIGSRLNTVMSGFQAVQGGLDKIVARGLARRLKDHLAGTAEMPTSALEEAGFDSDFMSALKQHFEANPRFDQFEGREVRALNIEAMSPEMRERLGTGLTRMQGRIIQKNFVGETSTWMNTWLGKTFTQFKTFSIVSAEKQLIHDLRGDKIKAAQILGLSVLASFMAYGVQSKLSSLGREDADEYLERRLSGNGLAFGIFTKMPQVAALSLAGDAFATLGLMPDDWVQGGGRAGLQPYRDLGDAVPSVGAVGDVFEATRMMSDYISGDDYLSTRQVADKLRRTVPLMNTIGVGQITKAGVDLLED